MDEFSMNTFKMDREEVIAVTVGYPKTRLMSLTVPKVGYLMCGMLNVEMLDKLHAERKIIAAQFTGIDKVDDLLTAQARQVTKEAERAGIHPGMTGRQIIDIMFKIKKDMEVREAAGDSGREG